MSIEAHIDAIAHKRKELKDEIAREMAHASPDFARITYLKKQNLRLKEEMQHCFHTLNTAATG